MKHSSLSMFSILGLAPVLIFSLSGCGSSSDIVASGDGDSAEKGELYISLTDAEGDFTSYTVSIDSLKLYREGGAVVETLSNSNTLDFAQYVDVSEFLTTASVPVGSYSKAEITLDFSDAEISVENSTGDSIPAIALDEDGEALSTVTLQALINGSEGFEIRRGGPVSLNIDFDLEASNEVTINETDDAATITVNPVLIADTSIDAERDQRVRGLLNSVDEDAATFSVDIRPFRSRNHSHGQISVQTADDTSYEIDGEVYSGSAGLQALAALEQGSAIVVMGTLNAEDRSYSAAEVFAGGSVAWDDKDMLKGSVIARAGNTLTVLGASVERHDGRFVFNDEITITIDDLTQVVRQGGQTDVGIVDISIGQQIEVLGQVGGDGVMDASGEEGVVRMRYSDLSATVVSVSPLQLDIQDYNRRSVSRYDFSGTGTDSAYDADPDQYEVDSGSLSLSGLEIDSPVKLRGFPSAFGSAPQDFVATTIANVGNVVVDIAVGYGRNGSGDAVVSVDENGLQLSLDSAELRHHMVRAGVRTDLNELSSMPLLAPVEDGARFAIQRGRSLQLFLNWSDFQQALADYLADGEVVAYVHSRGLYDAATLQQFSHHLVVRLAGLSSQS